MDWKGNIKILFTDHMTVYVENSEEVFYKIAKPNK